MYRRSVLNLRKENPNLSPQRRAAEAALTKLKSTLETEAGRGYVTIDHYLTARSGEAESGVVMPSTDPGTGFYDVGQVVATGGMGAIIQAKDRNLERTVAMKIMLNSSGATEAAIYNFIAEAKITGQLEHPNIVPLHDMGVAADGTIYYTMKLIEGTSLREILQKIRDGDQETVMHYPLSRLLEIFQKVCDGIAYAHSRRVVHRDLKPDNVMVGAFGEVLVLDWGIAKVLRDTPTHEETAAGQEGIGEMPDAGGGEFATMVGQVKGTPNYMAPEQAEGRVNDIDERTDIYALGGILYTILTLYPPIVGNNVMEILEKVSSGDITAPTAFNQTQSGGKSSGNAKSPAPPVPILPLPHLPEAKIPSALSAVAMKAMALKKEDRYQDVDELQGEIRRYLGGFATSAEDASALTQIKLMLGRHKKELAIATVFLAIAAGIGVFAIGKVIHSSIVAKKAREAAEQQLAELRATAPTFAAAARAALDQGRFNDALGITNAITFNPTNAEYHLLKGHILQSMLQVNEAHDAYVTARDYAATNNPALAALAEKNRALCGILKQKPKLDLPEFRQLYEAMLAQGRIKEASLMSARLGSVDQQLFENLKRKLVTANVKGELTRDVNGRLSLDMAGANIASLAALRGIPLAELNMAGCANVDDLTPLEGLKLERLDASGTKVNDLSSLRGMPIASLNLAGTKVDDLNPLDKMPLTELNLSNCLAVANIAPLRSAKLTRLNLAFTQVRDLTPISGQPVVWLNLYRTKVQQSDLDALKGMPLGTLFVGETGVRSLNGLTNAPLEYLDIHKTSVSDLSPLRQSKLQTLLMDNTPVRDLSPLRGMSTLRFVSANYTEVADLSPLAGLPVSTLRLANSRVSDLSPLDGAPFDGELDLSNTSVKDIRALKGMPLQTLKLQRTQVSDISWLENMPLHELRLDETNVKNFLPIASLQQIERLSLPFPLPRANIEGLRTHPSIKVLSYNVPVDKWERATTKEAFWKDFDARNRGN